MVAKYVKTLLEEVYGTCFVASQNYGAIYDNLRSLDDSSS